MRKITLTLLCLTFLIGCGSDKVTIPDNGDLIDANTARILLLEASQEVQDLRLSALESEDVTIHNLLSSMSSLINDYLVRLEAAEENLIDLKEDLDTLRGDLHTLSEKLPDGRCFIELYDYNRRCTKAKVILVCESAGVELKGKYRILFDNESECEGDEL